MNRSMRKFALLAVVSVVGLLAVGVAAASACGGPAVARAAAQARAHS